MDYYKRKQYLEMGVNPNQVVRWFQEACRQQWEARKVVKLCVWETKIDYENPWAKSIADTSATMNKIIVMSYHAKDRLDPVAEVEQ